MYQKICDMEIYRHLFNACAKKCYREYEPSNATWPRQMLQNTCMTALELSRHRKSPLNFAVGVRAAARCVLVLSS